MSENIFPKEMTFDKFMNFKYKFKNLFPEIWINYEDGILRLSDKREPVPPMDKFIIRGWEVNWKDLGSDEKFNKAWAASEWLYKYFDRGLTMNDNKEQKDAIVIEKFEPTITIDEIFEDVKEHVGSEYEAKIEKININYHSDKIRVFVSFTKKQKATPVFITLPKGIEEKLNGDRKADKALITIGDAVVNALENYYEV